MSSKNYNGEKYNKIYFPNVFITMKESMHLLSEWTVIFF